MSWSVYLIIEGARHGFKTFDNVLAILFLLTGPPVALLVLGVVARWAFRGFRPD
jgi:hypothetical protein